MKMMREVWFPQNLFRKYDGIIKSTSNGGPKKRASSIRSKMVQV